MNPIYRYPDNAILASALARNIRMEINKVLDGQDQFFLAVSGGRTPAALFRALAMEQGHAIDWKKVRIFFVDERGVAPDDPQSNYRMLQEKLLASIDIPEANVFRMKGEDDPVKAAQEYTAQMKKLLPQKEGWPIFDSILLGLGDDGHTASIFPGQLHLLDHPDWCTATVHPDTGQNRITLTGKTINHARHITFLVSGKEKSGVLRNIVLREKGYEGLPASKISPVYGTLEWFIDAGAAAAL